MPNETLISAKSRAAVQLLPSQALDLGYQASAAISTIARVAQASKDAINADTVTTAEQVAEIEAGVVWP